jgi:hypothetical protein
LISALFEIKLWEGRSKKGRRQAAFFYFFPVFDASMFEMQKMIGD